MLSVGMAKGQGKEKGFSIMIFNKNKAHETLKKPLKLKLTPNKC